MGNYSIFDYYEEFDTDIFGCNRHQLAYYLEPQGFDALDCQGELLKNGKIRYHKRPQLATFERLLPKTTRIAKYTLDYFGKRARYGRQLPLPKGGWDSVIAGNIRTIKGREITNKYLSPIDLINSYGIDYKYAIGNTDRFEPVNDKYNYQTNQWDLVYNSIRCIRIDVDMRSVWEHNREELLRPELMCEKSLAYEFGYDYNVFKTGGKGHQAILTLPIPLIIQHVILLQDYTVVV